MRIRPITQALFFVLAFGTGAALCAADHEPYAMLRRIQTPGELVYPHLPRRYRVPVKVEGSVAEEIRATLNQLKLDPPRFEERMASKGDFHLVLANTSYPRETREMIGGILNPIELIDLVIRSVVRYRDPKQFDLLVKETDIQISRGSWQGKPVRYVELTPAGERFAYTYEDRGASVHESWLTGLALTIDTTSNLVYELVQQKHKRAFRTDQADKPTADTVRSTYHFNYDTLDGALLPVELSLTLNGRKALRIAASYRKVDRHVVFDSRSICYYRDEGEGSCLTMSYGTYDLSRNAAKVPMGAHSRKYTRALGKAAELSREAAEDLRTGEIGSAVRRLHRLVEHYPDTPQAVEARKLLSSLPRGL